MSSTAADVVRPPTKPPPGELCPAKSKYIANPNKIKTIKDDVTCKIKLFGLYTRMIPPSSFILLSIVSELANKIKIKNRKILSTQLKLMLILSSNQKIKLLQMQSSHNRLLLQSHYYVSLSNSFVQQKRTRLK